MLSIELTKGRTNVLYILVMVAVLLLVFSLVLVYDFSKADAGGANASNEDRTVESYGDGKFIDATGDAKLIYTIVSDTETEKTVRITDMKRDPRSSSFTTFPDSVRYDGNTYSVVGNTVTYDESSKKYVDGFGLEYKLAQNGSGKNIAWINSYSSSSTSVIFPAKIYYNNAEYPVAGVQSSSTDFQNATITDLTIIVSYDDYKLGAKFMLNNKNLYSLKFIVDNDDPSTDGYVDIQTAFKGCTGLTTLVLPNVLHRADNAFEGCTGLGSDSENPFLFNTKLRITQTETSNVFVNCIDTDGNGLKYLELGTNVNKVSTIFSGCSGIKIIYNTGTTITESDIASSILESGSHNVILFYNPGGKFTKWSSITTVGTSNTITMPKGTFGGVSIPEWSHKDGIARYNSGNEYSSFSPWSTSEHEYSYYYYALYGSCTITYHVTYKDSTNAVQTDTKTQTVVCMYNTHLYDETTYPDETTGQIIKSKMKAQKADLKWTDTANLKNITKYCLGQSMTAYCDLDLSLYLDSASSESITITFTWDYIWKDSSSDTLSVVTYTTTKATTGYGLNLLTLDDFKTATTLATDANGALEYINEYYLWSGSILWSSLDGNIMNSGYCTFYDDATLTLKRNSGDFYYNTDNQDARWYSGSYSSVTVNPDIFYPGSSYKTNSYFKYWKTPTDVIVYPGDVHTPASVYNPRLSAVFSSGTENATVTYNLYPNEAGTYVSETDNPEFGASYNLKEYPRSGYKLVGWSYTKSGNVNFPLGTPVTMLSDLRLYAVWEEGSSSQSPTVITDNLLISIDNVPAESEGYKTKSLFIGTLAEGDNVVWNVIFSNSVGEVVTKPTDVGVYTINVGYQVFNGTTDVTKNYYSDYDGNPVTYNCYFGFLTIYSGERSTVTD